MKKKIVFVLCGIFLSLGSFLSLGKVFAYDATVSDFLMVRTITETINQHIEEHWESSRDKYLIMLNNIKMTVKHDSKIGYILSRVIYNLENNEENTIEKEEENITERWEIIIDNNKGRSNVKIYIVSDNEKKVLKTLSTNSWANVGEARGKYVRITIGSFGRFVSEIVKIDLEKKKIVAEYNLEKETVIGKYQLSPNWNWIMYTDNEFAHAVDIAEDRERRKKKVTLYAYDLDSWKRYVVDYQFYGNIKEFKSKWLSNTMVEYFDAEQNKRVRKNIKQLKPQESNFYKFGFVVDWHELLNNETTLDFDERRGESKEFRIKISALNSRLRSDKENDWDALLIFQKKDWNSWEECNQHDINLDGISDKFREDRLDDGEIKTEFEDGVISFDISFENAGTYRIFVEDEDTGNEESLIIKVK